MNGIRNSHSIEEATIASHALFLMQVAKNTRVPYASSHTELCTQRARRGAAHGRAAHVSSWERRVGTVPSLTEHVRLHRRALGPRADGVMG